MNLINFPDDITSVTDVGLVREHNEDNCKVTNTANGILCVVCDGMGGHAGGAEASRIAVDCIVQHLNREVYSDVREALRDALEFANMQIIGTASEHPKLRGMGTTACVLLIREEEVWIAHAGDSRIYLYVAKQKRLHRLTKDHSFVQGLIDQGVIYAEEAENHHKKNHILKALGAKEELEPEIAEEPVLPARDDIFLVCSDGLSGMVSDEQIEEVLSEKSELKQKEAILMDMAKIAGGKDNITLQLVHISNSRRRKSVFKSKNNEPEPIGRLLTWKTYAALAVIIFVLAVNICYHLMDGGGKENVKAPPAEKENTGGSSNKSTSDKIGRRCIVDQDMDSDDEDFTPDDTIGHKEAKPAEHDKTGVTTGSTPIQNVPKSNNESRHDNDRLLIYVLLATVAVLTASCIYLWTGRRADRSWQSKRKKSTQENVIFRIIRNIKR